MERNVQKNGLVNLAVAILVFAATLAVAGYSGSQAGRVSAVFLGITVLAAFVSWFQMRLEESERQEKFEVEELARAKGDSGLFESKDAELFPARRGREQFERFFVPAFVVLLMLLEAGAAYWLWQKVSPSKVSTGIMPQRATHALAAFAFFALVLFWLGRFTATFARLEKHPLLRPNASFVLLSAYICFITALGIAGVKAEFYRADLYVARALTILLGLMSAEMLVALLLEMYRPRVKGKVARPLYDSRLVGLLGQPESLFTTAAQTLDYQFGFKVSETWLFQLLKKNLLMLLAVQLVVLLLSTCVVFIDVGEQAVLERFGRPVEGRTLLNPGPHLKWPWPVDQTYRYHTEQIQSFNVGFTNDPSLGSVKTLVWTVPHDRPEKFLVANRAETTVTETNDTTGQKAPPVSLLAVSIPVQYQIQDLLAWVYKNEDASDLLQSVAARDVMRYLARSDMNEVMSHGRVEAADILRQQIQADADAHNLGVKIVFVGLQDIHPPVEVAPDYEKVVASEQSKLAKIIAAQGNAIRANALADGQSFKLLREAEGNRIQREKGASAQATAFTNQMQAFHASPQFYAERKYDDTFKRATAGTRKYILLATNTQDVIVFDLQDKLSADFLDMTVKPPAKSP